MVSYAIFDTKISGASYGGAQAHDRCISPGLAALSQLGIPRYRRSRLLVERRGVLAGTPRITDPRPALHLDFDFCSSRQPGDFV